MLSLVRKAPRRLLTYPVPVVCPACCEMSMRRARLHSSIVHPSQPALENSRHQLPPIAVETTPAPPKASPISDKGKGRVFKARKAAVELTPTAVVRIKALLDQPIPQLIRVGVRNKGCAGMSYHLDYVAKPERFDEVVEQDGVKVVVDSKALFSIIGSIMDWQEDALGAKFVFKNPNIKDACGCGESFTV